MSLEQRQRYQQDFCAEYDEYKDLHSRIATITRMFVQLGSKIKSLSPGTPEYKVPSHEALGRIIANPHVLFDSVEMIRCFHHSDNGRPNTGKVQQISKGEFSSM